MKRLAILGASGHGKVVADCAELCGWESISFIDDAWPGKQVNGVWPVVGDTQTLLGSVKDFDGVLVAIGNNQVREAKLITLSDSGASMPVLVHPAAVVSRYAEVGAGSVIFAGAVVNVDSASELARLSIPAPQLIMIACWVMPSMSALALILLAGFVSVIVAGWALVVLFANWRVLVRM